MADKIPPHIRAVLMDALAEYVSHRGEGDAQAYVAKRYAWLQDPAKMEAKALQVDANLRAANALRNNIDQLIETAQKILSREE